MAEDKPCLDTPGVLITFSPEIRQNHQRRRIRSFKRSKAPDVLLCPRILALNRIWRPLNEKLVASRWLKKANDRSQPPRIVPN